MAPLVDVIGQWTEGKSRSTARPFAWAGQGLGLQTAPARKVKPEQGVGPTNPRKTTCKSSPCCCLGKVIDVGNQFK
ncbi:hypothetical protein Pyn_11841 [Prunus yedoensis var. nudiflora]|uniref:Uncharacterized protein n=1 Tax=Prunus yedoensis var. nudiflora TaxID=2094558 RepID=A0A314YDH6_PRUYE|nr:hypothetical protein Pyn_11841 [Prunus yedoensis var. nudiflora]